MESQLGTAAKRGFWLALALAGLSLLVVFFTPVAGALRAAFWLAVAWGIRRRQWWAPLAGLATLVLEVLVALWHGAAVAATAAFVSSTLFSLACGYYFLRALLDLKSDEGGPRLDWPWVAWLGANALFWLCCEPFTIPNDSMRQTLLSGDYLLVEKASVHLGRAPRRGDLVVFHYPVDPKQVFVKRVVGVPGDRLRIANKQLFRNGAAVAEPYAIHATSYQDPYRDNFPSAPNGPIPQPGLAMLSANVQGNEVIVPAGKYFVMGDNRDDSLDSRYWGFVSDAEIVGRPFLIYASYNLESGESEHMATAFNTRWDRLLKPL